MAYKCIQQRTSGLWWVGALLYLISFDVEVGWLEPSLQGLPVTYTV